MRLRTAFRAIVLVVLIAAAGAGPAVAEGMRNIASVAFVSYFDDAFRFDRTFRIESSDTFLARLFPGFTLLARVSRNDTLDYSTHAFTNQHVFTLGPVVNFSDTTYADLSYGLGIDSAGAFTHEAEANFNYETESTWAGVGVRAVFFPASGYYYLLPSFSGKFHPVPALGLFGKAFISVDSEGVVTNSFWGEADYTFSPTFQANAGLTVSRAEAFGYSLIVGARVSFTAKLSLQYSLQYLSGAVTYLAEPKSGRGISNGLILDWKF